MASRAASLLMVLKQGLPARVVASPTRRFAERRRHHGAAHTDAKVDHSLAIIRALSELLIVKSRDVRIPKEFPPYSTVQGYFYAWSHQG
jgi:hypothetical protein